MHVVRIISNFWRCSLNVSQYTCFMIGWLPASRMRNQMLFRCIQVFEFDKRQTRAKNGISVGEEMLTNIHALNNGMFGVVWNGGY
jgi:hypothetical protein